MQTNIIKHLGSLALVTGALAYSVPAFAQQENVIIVIDSSGSMATAAPGGDPKWDIALDQAEAFVSLPHADREYELWTFSGAAWTRHYSFADGAGLSVSQRQADVLGFINSLSGPFSTTPLAGTLCDAVDSLIAHEATVFPPPAKRIVLVTDGLENATNPSHACHGSPSATPYDETNPNRGGLTVNSWEWHVLNKAITGDPNSTSNPPPGFELLVDVSALFDYIPTASLGQSADPVLVEYGPMGMTYSAPLSLEAVAFFQGLAESTGGTYTQIDPATPPPTPGDVNEDGCTDYDDYVQIVTYYGQPVSNPASDQADLTRDGFVDYYDYLVVIQHWGAGPNC